MKKYKTAKAKEAIELRFSKKTADLAETLHTPFDDDKAFLSEAKKLLEKLGETKFMVMVNRMEVKAQLPTNIKLKPLERFLEIHKTVHFTPANLAFIAIFSFPKNRAIVRKALAKGKQELESN